MQPYHRTVLRRYDNAVRDHAFLGSVPDADRRAEIQQEYDRAKAALVRLLDKIPNDRTARCEG